MLRLFKVNIIGALIHVAGASDSPNLILYECFVTTEDEGFVRLIFSE